jgi:hypothetical protein
MQSKGEKGWSAYQKSPRDSLSVYGKTMLDRDSGVLET